MTQTIYHCAWVYAERERVREKKGIEKYIEFIYYLKWEVGASAPALALRP